MLNVPRHRVTMLGGTGAARRLGPAVHLRVDGGGRAPLLDAGSRHGLARRAWDHGEVNRLSADGHGRAAPLPRRGDPHAVEGADWVRHGYSGILLSTTSQYSARRPFGKR